MRDVREWAVEFAHRSLTQSFDSLVELTEAIQSDAARSERERAAALVEKRAECGDRALAAAIRNLPDVGDGRSGHAI